MAIFIPQWEKYRERKPSNSRLNENHELVSFFDHVWLMPGEGSWAVDVLGDQSLDLSEHGIVGEHIKFKGSNSNDLSRRIVSGTSDMTFFFAGMSTNTATSLRVIFGQDPSGSNTWRDWMLYTKGTTLTYYTINTDTTRVSHTHNNRPTYSHVCGREGTRHFITVDGNYSETVGAVRDLSGFKSEGFRRETAWDKYTGEMGIAALGVKPMPEAAAAMLSEAPYQILKPRRKFWVMPSGVTGTTSTTSGTTTDSITEADIVAGGKTTILTLTNDTWVADDGTFAAVRQAIINKQTSAQTETFGWNNEVRDKAVPADVARTDDNTVTIIWGAAASYDITAQEEITPGIPASALVTSTIDVVSSPTFTVDIVAAAAWANDEYYRTLLSGNTL